MSIDTDLTEVRRQYAEAYAAHYSQRDLPRALALYTQLIAGHPTEQEANDSRMQLQNIVNAVVPKQELMDVQIEQVLAHFDLHGASTAAPISVTTRDS